MRETNITPLLQLLRDMTSEERGIFARKADTTEAYLYHLATGGRKKTSVQLAVRLEDATREMHRDSMGRLPIITVRELATMHAAAGF